MKTEKEGRKEGRKEGKKEGTVDEGNKIDLKQQTPHNTHLYRRK